MKITKSQLKQIILEELGAIRDERRPGPEERKFIKDTLRRLKKTTYKNNPGREEVVATVCTKDNICAVSKPVRYMPDERGLAYAYARGAGDKFWRKEDELAIDIAKEQAFRALLAKLKGQQ